MKKSNKNFISNSPTSKEKEPKGYSPELVRFMINFIIFALLIYGLVIIVLAIKCHVPPFQLELK